VLCDSCYGGETCDTGLCTKDGSCTATDACGDGTIHGSGWGICYCDARCEVEDDCCSDYVSECFPDGCTMSQIETQRSACVSSGDYKAYDANDDCQTHGWNTQDACQGLPFGHFRCCDVACSYVDSAAYSCLGP
jgi:hypothetical protein